MKNKKVSKAARLCMLTGLLVMVSTHLLNHFINLPDITKGCMLGIGIGLELTGLFLMTRNNKGNSASV